MVTALPGVHPAPSCRLTAHAVLGSGLVDCALGQDLWIHPESLECQTQGCTVPCLQLDRYMRAHSWLMNHVLPASLAKLGGQGTIARTSCSVHAL